MKASISWLLALIVLVQLSTIGSAQNWQTPVLMETLTGMSGGSSTINSSQIVKGNPAIAYRSSSHRILLYVRALDASGTTWGNPIPVELAGDPGSYLSLLVVNGMPAICYTDGLLGHLKYIRALDSTGTAWGTPVTVDAVGSTGYYNSMQIVNGYPAISYNDGNNGDLKFKRALDVNGASWNTPSISVDVLGNVGQYTSLQIIDGNPAISYYDVTNGNLKYVRATNVSGTAWASALSLDAGGNVGEFTSLQMVNGNPAISYFDRTNADLKYIQATDASGTTWGTPVSIDAAANVGYYSKLMVANGNPVIAYFTSIATSNLKFVRATDVSGTSWGTPLMLEAAGSINQLSVLITNGNPSIAYSGNDKVKFLRATDISGAAWGTPASIDLTNDVGQFLSMQMINGNPAISYHEGYRYDLRYVRATNATGTSWGTPVVIEETGVVGRSTSLQQVNGNPAIAYYSNSPNYTLKYVRANDATGTVWGTPITVDGSVISVGNYASMQIVNGYPAIAYYDETNDDLKFVYAVEPSGLGWGVPLSLDMTGEVGRYLSLQIINGYPAVSYYDETNGNLKYIRATNASGSTWGTPVTVDASGDVGFHTSLQLVDGVPCISYYDVTNQDLKFVRATNASGSTWGTPVTIDATDEVGEYSSLQVIGGVPAISYFDASNNKLKYAKASDISGTTWPTPVNLTHYGNIYGNILQHTSMLPMGTGARIAYYNSVKKAPFYIYGTCDIADAPTVSASSSTICAGSSTTLTITSGALKDAANWKWYSGSCGGTLVGTGVSISVSPATTTTYYARGEGGCPATGTCASVEVTVNPLPTVTLGAMSPVCVNSAAFALTTGSPASGTYTGTGVSGGQFTPATAGVGTYTITYSYTDANTCTKTATTSLQVNNAPASVTLGSFNAVCENIPSFALTGGSPGPGVYSGTGVSSGSFSPVTSGSGTHTITYTYTNGFSCSKSATSTILVNAAPSVTLSAFSSVCTETGLFALTGGSPAGGTYSGTGVNSGNFNTLATGAGVYAINYSYTDANSCTKSASSNLTVGICSGVAEGSEINGTSVYPNPAKGNITITSSYEAGTFELYNATGMLVFTKKLEGTTTICDLQTIAEGLYSYRIKNTKGVSTGKIIVQ